MAHSLDVADDRDDLFGDEDQAEQEEVEVDPREHEDDTIDGLLADDEDRQDTEEDQAHKDNGSVHGHANDTDTLHAQASMGAGSRRPPPAAYFMDAADMILPEPSQQAQASMGPGSWHDGQQGHGYAHRRRDTGHERGRGRAWQPRGGRAWGSGMGPERRPGFGRDPVHGPGPGFRDPAGGHMGHMSAQGMGVLPLVMPPAHLMMAAMQQHMGPRPPAPPPRPPAGPPPSSQAQPVSDTAGNLGMPSILRPGAPPEPAPCGPAAPVPHSRPHSLDPARPKPPPHLMPPVVPGQPPPVLMMPPVAAGLEPHHGGWRPPLVPGAWPPAPHQGLPSPKDPSASPLGLPAPAWPAGPAWPVGGFPGPVAPRPNKWVRPGASTAAAAGQSTGQDSTETPESKEAELQRKLALIKARKKEQEERQRAAQAAPAATPTGARPSGSAPASAPPATSAALLQAHEEYIEKLRHMIALQEATINSKGTDSGAGSMATDAASASEMGERPPAKRTASRSLSPPLAAGASAPTVKRARRVVRAPSATATALTKGASKESGDWDGALSGAQFCEEAEPGSQQQAQANGHDDTDGTFAPEIPSFVLGAPALEEDELGIEDVGLSGQTGGRGV